MKSVLKLNLKKQKLEKRNHLAYESVNPFNGKKVEIFHELTNEQLEAKIAKAAVCCEMWRNKSYAQRAVIVAKAAELMHLDKDRFAKHSIVEMGKPINEARGEVDFSANVLSYCAKNIERLLGPAKLHPTHGADHTESSPIGVVFGVEPWNFSYYQSAHVAGTQLMVGNAILVKHARCVQQCAIEFEKLWIDAGAPEGLYTNLIISEEQSDKFLDDPRIKGVALDRDCALYTFDRRQWPLEVLLNHRAETRGRLGTLLGTILG